MELSEAAKMQVKRLLAKEGKSDFGLRLGVEGGGCSGLSYNLKFDAKRTGDNVFEMETFFVVVDPKSFLYLKGITLDYVDGLQGNGFKFINPNAKTSCGCGESFSA